MSRPYDLIILDRDGVINHDSDEYIKSLEEWQPIEGSIDAIARLHRAGYAVGVATNQSGLARGYYTDDVLASMHERLADLVQAAHGRVDHIAYCPHGPDDGCQCRKPRTGLLESISQATGIALGPRVLMVGDSLGDLEAGRAAGCDIALVATGKGARTQARLQGHPDPLIATVRPFADLGALVDTLT